MSDIDRPARRRGRGLVSGCIPQLALLLLIGAGVFIGVDYVTAPWIYNVGGQHRLLPIWGGYGVAHAPASGGDYAIYLSFSPQFYGFRTIATTDVRGWGAVCAPGGKTYPVLIEGGTPGVVRDMDGRPFSLRLEDRPAIWQTSDPHTWVPRLWFDGRWAGPNLVMNDEASIAQAFRPDGGLTRDPNSYPERKGPVVPITFVEGPKSAFHALCAGR